MGYLTVYTFKNQLNMISDEELRSHVREIMNLCDDYNLIGSSSSSGKYHSKNDCGFGGNYNHTINVLHCVLRLAESVPLFDDPEEKDVLIAAALLHDMCKYSNEDYSHTVFDHPQRIYNLIRSYGFEKHPKLVRIADCVHSHMSRWNTNSKYPEIELPVPKNLEQIMLSYADMIASDKNIEFSIDK